MMQESKVFWPLVLFPYAVEKAHTRCYTGRCWVKDIKASFSFANLTLRDWKLTCRYRAFHFPIIELFLTDINDVKKVENKPGLILIKFRHATFGKLAKIALSGQPKGSQNQVIINVRDDQAWLEKLNTARHLSDS